MVLARVSRVSNMSASVLCIRDYITANRMSYNYEYRYTTEVSVFIALAIIVRVTRRRATHSESPASYVASHQLHPTSIKKSL